ncbi:hypothetical protein BAOM_3367 [Peribacillus asahii]|uniref:Uncharacterized protein n=1 Tax=Peribacillus asahii TaxID=228899 RepID=A0A3Q9RP24_9BACI|nr:hypothetical protein BAOM_3367 [Peribacillus asahii]
MLDRGLIQLLNKEFFEKSVTSFGESVIIIRLNIGLLKGKGYEELL